LSNTMEFALCYRRLKKYARFSVGCLRGVLAPIGCSLVGGVAARVVVGLPFLNTPLSGAMAGTAVYLVLFLLLARPLYLQLLGKERAAS
ncbi:MAG: hypothetical protein IJD82_03725, partial [Clostridia bacterium]|nr:hypothetical protein [Clostridia bacterium]